MTRGCSARNILVVYRYGEYPPRATIWDHLYSLERYSGHRCFYVNLLHRSLPLRFLRAVPIDLIVFHTTFLSARWSERAFAEMMCKAEPLRLHSAVKLALPQDEFIHTDPLCDFISEFGVNHVFSVSPPSEWPKIYNTVDREAVQLHQVLTGYLDEKTLKRIRRLEIEDPKRDIDIGYRAWRAAPWLGRHGYMKAQMDEVFSEEGPKRGLAVDISTRAEDTLLGDDWYRFLLRSRYTIGVEGGASILDRDGAIRRRTDAYVAEHPDAGFEEVEAACFPGVDGAFALFAISPRHLEACATQTCQILVEGDYNGILEPNRHYIPLRADFSNVDEILSGLQDEVRRTRIATQAYEEIVASGRYTYEGFARFVLETALSDSHLKERGFLLCWLYALTAQYALLIDRVSWIAPIIYRRVIAPAVRALAFVSPRAAKAVFRKLKRMTGRSR